MSSTCLSIGATPKNPDLTILMPCLNEARTLSTCIDKAQRFISRRRISAEILVADNGSTDGSQAIAAALGARVVRVENRGYGNALRAGIEEARGAYIIMGDADDSYDFLALDPFIDKLSAGADVVIGNRFLGGIAPGAMPVHHRFLGNPVLSLIGRLLFHAPIGDFHCGLRGFRREAMLSVGLHCEGMEFASEMIVKSALAGLRIEEVPTTLSKDGRNRPPHLRSFRDGWRHLSFLFLHCPRWIFLYPALSLLAAGVALQAALYGGPLFIGGAGFDIHTMLAAALFTIIGLQLSIFWLLAQYSAWANQLVPNLSPAAKLLTSQRWEWGFLLGGCLLAGGLAALVFQAASWSALGFPGLDPQSTMRALIPAASAVIAGAEVAMASLLLQILKIGYARRSVIEPPSLRSTPPVRSAALSTLT